MSKRHVYFILCGQHVKIGVAVQPSRRLAYLQVGSPSELTLLGSVKTEHAELLERALHALFEAERVRGEWFNYTAPHVRALIAALLGGQESALETIGLARQLKRLGQGLERLERRNFRYEKSREERLAKHRALADSAQDKIDAWLLATRKSSASENSG